MPRYTDINNTAPNHSDLSLVHGFSESYYNVTEGDSLTIDFHEQVKGGGSSLRPDLKGTILSEGAEPDGRLS